MITASYEQVLDATKHQDDKIGQLLTGISFLTAAALALTALDSGDLIRRTFVINPYKLPLALIFLIAFLVGVAWTVVLLVAALSPPLRFPNLHQGPFSQVFFHEITITHKSDWYTRWTDSTPAKLEKERFESLVRETRNLSLRTDDKYNRTSEAFPLLSTSLFAFILSTIFVGFVAGTTTVKDPSASPVILYLWQRLIIGLLFGCYSSFQIFTWIKGKGKIDDSGPLTNKSQKTKEEENRWRKLCPPALLALLMITMLTFDSSFPWTIDWIAVPLTIFFSISWMPSTTRYLTSAALATPLAAIWLVGGWEGNYFWQLAAATFIIIFLTGLMMSEPARRVRANGREKNLKLEGYSGHPVEVKAHYR